MLINYKEHREQLIKIYRFDLKYDWEKLADSNITETHKHDAACLELWEFIVRVLEETNVYKEHKELIEKDAEGILDILSCNYDNEDVTMFLDSFPQN